MWSTSPGHARDTLHCCPEPSWPPILHFSEPCTPGCAQTFPDRKPAMIFCVCMKMHGPCSTKISVGRTLNSWQTFLEVPRPKITASLDSMSMAKRQGIMQTFPNVPWPRAPACHRKCQKQAPHQSQDSAPLKCKEPKHRMHI